MGRYSLEGHLRYVIIGQQVERRPGEVDRSEPPLELHRLHRLLVQHHAQSPSVGRATAASQQVGGRVEPFDVDTGGDQIEQRVAVSAADFEGRFTRHLHELLVDARIGRGGPERGVRLGDDPGVEELGGGELMGQFGRAPRVGAARRPGRSG